MNEPPEPLFSDPARKSSTPQRVTQRPRRRPTEPTLAASLIKCLCKSNYHDLEQEYYPESGVRQLITVQSINKELNRCTESALAELGDREALVQTLAEQCYKTFATAIVTGLQPDDLFYFLDDFVAQDYTDDDLGVILEEEICEHMADDSFKAHKFCSERWKFLAPTFSPDKYDYNLPHDCIFPFTKDATMSRRGAFGTVSRVEIHADYLKHLDMQYVAVKEIQIPQDGEKNATDKAWEDEAKALSGINDLNHSNITQCIAAIRRGEHRYFMFKWAEGGNLQEYWKKAPRHAPDTQSIRDMIEQLRGLVDALDALHNCRSDKQGLLKVPNSHGAGSSRTEDNDKSIRHGDLKPENVLRFISRKNAQSFIEESQLGTLKIADMGLAKQHIVATQLRTNTSQRYGTIRYEAPEAITETKGRSRLYDIWSFGCITLEFIIWVLYGNMVLEEFYHQVEAGRQQTCQYFELDAERKVAVLHRTVDTWIQHMYTSDPECSQDSVIRDLLSLVRNKLLVVNLGPSRKQRNLLFSHRPDPVSDVRATAAETRETLDVIIQKAKRDASYLYTGKVRDNIQLPRRSSLLEVPSGSPRGYLPTHSRSRGITTRISGISSHTRLEYSLPPLKDWEFPVDNAFADAFRKKVGTAAFHQPLETSPTLCARCNDLDLFKGGFTLQETLTSLQISASTCALCSMLKIACRRRRDTKVDNILIERDQSNLKLSGQELPILSILRSSELQTPRPIQIGLPVLPKPGSAVFYDLIRLWLQDCDAEHAGCRPVTKEKTQNHVRQGFPTRLIDVGTKDELHLRLLETKEQTPMSRDYIALSHPWGDVKVYPPFSTWRRDSSGLNHDVEAFKRVIPYEKLPATFRDAVDCTRALGIQYLWIDSICIIQGRDGDFSEESKNMEEVFSGAYCVLAASRAAHQHSGFLGPRAQRQYIPFHRSRGKSFYICDPIDDFGKDVIAGSLNQRGWVLQERALARRTIYFTESQTYFECGNGIRCETLANMHNNMADFIGDPRFPEKAMSANSRALQIAYYQDLYKLYSRLEFSHDEDRPFAIAGLEKRLRQAFGTQGGFGIFDDGDKAERGLFHRSILWRRGDDNESKNGLEPIDFSRRGFHVPSWSWMAYKGGIDYTTPEGGTADWETNEISEPWTRGFIQTTRSAPQEGIVSIPAIVRDFQVANRLADEVKLYYDTGRTKGSDGQRAQCVVVAKDKRARSEGRKRHYVLLVAPRKVESGRGRKVYERIGAGYLLGKHITFSDPGIEAEIW